MIGHLAMFWTGNWLTINQKRCSQMSLEGKKQEWF